MDYLIEIKGVYYRYGAKADSHSLKDVSIKIREGVRTVLLGANGAGKSTLFYHFNGVLKPESGEVLYRGIPLSYEKRHLYQLREDISVVVQNPDEQIFSSTVEEDVAFGPMNLNLPPDVVEGRIRDCLFKVGMEEFRYRPTTQLSYGQRKRVAIAGALAMEPKVLILDEPTAGLDPQMSQEVMELVDQLCLSGTTVIISTHDVDLAYAWAEEIHVLRYGSLIYSGEPEQFFSDRENVALAGLNVPHTYSVNKSLETIRGNPECPHPRTNSQLLAKLSPEGAVFGKLHVVSVSSDEVPSFDDDVCVGIYGFRTRQLFNSEKRKVDVYFNAVEGCCLSAMQGRETVLYCDGEMVDAVVSRIKDLQRFGRSPEVIL
ncbi:MAG: energy-coupling factor ABC transporter ATP-binding protein [Candidatus Methanomethylophilaceae archaeon]